MMASEYAKVVAMERRRLTKASELLLGLVTGIVADEQLHDLEIRLLQTWLASNPEVADTWPGSTLAHQVSAVLADGIVTDAERTHLLRILQQFSVAEFAETGAVTPEVLQLPIDDDSPVQLRNSAVCLTGEFLFGTRDACERATAAAGALPVDTVTRKLAYLVVGTNVSPHWANTSYGRKIQKAVDLKQRGIPVTIISERRWLAAIDGP